MPVAIGSSVPVCPICLMPDIFRKRDTTSCDVSPFGLLILMTPVSCVGVVFVILLVH